MRIWICDDDPGVQCELPAMIRKEEPDSVIETFSNCEEVLQRLQQETADIVFMDIVFRSAEGIVTAKRIRETCPQTQIIFITGHLEYAPDIFEARPVYLLLKPFKPQKLHDALTVASDMQQQDIESRITVRVGHTLRTIPIEAIEYIESQVRKVIIHGDFGVLECYGKLGELHEGLPESFIQCHKSFVVNARRIKNLRPDMIQMLSGAQVPIAQRRRIPFRHEVLPYLSLVQLPSGEFRHVSQL